MTSFTDELNAQNEKKLESAKKLFTRVSDSVDGKINDYKFHDFRNNLRMKLTNDWEKTGNQLVEFKYKNGYINQLEQLLFDLLNEK